MKPAARNFLLVFLAVVIAFGVGAAWQFASARAARTQLETANTELATVRSQLSLEQLQTNLALATVAAQLGNFERARQLASTFFTDLQTRMTDAPEAARQSMDAILQNRDAVITQLSRSEPGSGLALTRILADLRRALGGDATGLAPGGMPAAPVDSGR